jgi:hypothetical protein
MKGKKCRVIKEYNSPYTEPLIFNKKEIVAVGERDSEWAGWIWCTKESGESRWVPENYINIHGKTGKFLRDYNSKELAVSVGELYFIEEEEAEWFWVDDESGKKGWVPIRNVQIIEE